MSNHSLTAASSSSCWSPTAMLYLLWRYYRKLHFTVSSFKHTKMDFYSAEGADLQLCPTCFLLFAVPFKSSIELFAVSSIHSQPLRYLPVSYSLFLLMCFFFYVYIVIFLFHSQRCQRRSNCNTSIAVSLMKTLEWKWHPCVHVVWMDLVTKTY